MFRSLMDVRAEGYKLLYPDDGAGADGAGLTIDAGAINIGGAEVSTDTPDIGADTGEDNGGSEDLAAELAKAKADLQKFKSALDKAAAEAAQSKRELKKRQTAEEIAAEEKREADEKAAQELDELRRKVAKAEAVKSIMGKLNTNEEVSGKIAEYLYGAEDVDAALTEINRAWTAREKALKLEYGKIPPPGAGGADGTDPETEKAFKLAKELGQAKARNAESVQEQLKGLIR